MSSFCLGPCIPLLFWMYNSLSIAIFHFSWKMQSDVWGTVNASGISHTPVGSKVQIQQWLVTWFLWAQSQVIQSYGSALSAYGLIFLRRSLYFIQSYVLIQWSLLARINRINCLSTTKSSSSYSTSCLKHYTSCCWCCSLPLGGIATTFFGLEVRIILVKLSFN
jgi:hypothetical protein